MGSSSHPGAYEARATLAMMRIRTVLGTAALVGAAGLAYARWEATSYRLRREDLSILPAGHDPLRLLHLSDLHMTPARHRLREWVGGLAELRPDLVIVTGDIISHQDAVPLVFEALQPLQGLPGAFVLGSNDYYAPTPINPLKYFRGPSDVHPGREQLPWVDLVEGLTRAGWAYLGNASATVHTSVGDVALRGVDDPHIDRDDYDVVAGPTNGVTFGVAHAPYRRVLDAMSADGVDLILAGHTHGGQVRLPGAGALVTNCDLDRARARGLSMYGSSPLHVSAGLGTNPYAPIRFACPPEATLLTLTAAG
jgi:predicted MPP superfamily phosphohydrolase